MPPATAAAENAGPVPTLLATAPTTGAEQRPADGSGHGAADQLAAARGGRRVRQPGQASRPGAGSAQALDKPRRVEDCRRRGPAEGEGGHAHEPQAEQGDGPVPEAGHKHAPGQRTDQGAHRIRSDQDAGPGFRQVRNPGIVRQQRGQRREEDRVDQHQPAHKQQQNADAG